MPAQPLIAINPDNIQLSSLTFGRRGFGHSTPAKNRIGQRLRGTP
jgi:hypothetical protein